jgi:hypothetical protein
MQEVKKNLDRDNEWKTDFQNKLTYITDLVMKMGEKLDAEIDTRKTENLELKNDQLELKKTIFPFVENGKTFSTIKRRNNCYNNRINHLYSFKSN